MGLVIISQWFDHRNREALFSLLKRNGNTKRGNNEPVDKNNENLGFGDLLAEDARVSSGLEPTYTA